MSNLINKREVAKQHGTSAELSVRLDTWAVSSASPTLTDRALFERDQFTCLYCGRPHPPGQLRRDYYKRLEQGGRRRWENAISACHDCYHLRGERSAEQLTLAAIPYRPRVAEYRYLRGRRVLLDLTMALRNRALPVEMCDTDSASIWDDVSNSLALLTHLCNQEGGCHGYT